VFLLCFSNVGSTGRYEHEYIYGHGGAAGSSKQHTATFKPRQHPIYDETIDEEDKQADMYGSKAGGEGVWRNGKSYQMMTIAYHGTSKSGRRSDEVHIVSTKSIKKESRQSSVGSIDAALGWSMRPGMGTGIINKVNVQAHSQPLSLGGQ
jgi:hypothetical protein